MEQTAAQIVLLGIVMPTLIAGVASALAWGLLCDDETPAARRAHWAAPPALFLAFVCVLGATGGIPDEFWPGNVAERKLVIAAVALVAGMADALSPRRALGALAAALGGGGAAWVSLGALHPHSVGTGELVAVLVVAGVLTGACVWVYDRWEAGGGWMSVWGLALVAGGAVGVLFLGSVSETALHAGMLAGFFLAWGVVRMLIPRASVARGGTTALAVLLVGLLTMGRWLGLPPAPTLSYALVIIAVAGVGIGAALGRGRGWLVRLVLVLAATGAPLGAGVGLALAADLQREREAEQEAEDGGWGDYYESLPDESPGGETGGDE